MPKPYERTYKQGRALASVLQALGWLLACVGVLVIFIGFVSGTSPYGMLDGAGLVARLLATVPGLLITCFGLIALHVSHTARATYDTAELTRDLLSRSRKTTDTAAAPAMRAEPALRRPSNSS